MKQVKNDSKCLRRVRSTIAERRHAIMIVNDKRSIRALILRKKGPPISQIQCNVVKSGMSGLRYLPLKAQRTITISYILLYAGRRIDTKKLHLF